MNASASNDQQLSRGCQICQGGKWLCIFLTYACDAQCAFCPAPLKQVDKIVSAFGCDLSTVSKHLDNSSFEGISFSGGECFLVFDRVIEWLSYLKRRFPHFYFWAYTNGIALDENQMFILASKGLNELRFNIAATGYDSTLILDKIRAAARIFDFVAVEIPSIPDDYPKLEPVLSILDDINVRYLNLHEYIVVSRDPSQIAARGTFVMNKETEIHYDVDSLMNSEQIMDYCRNKKLRLLINNCSLDRKEVQLLQRRLVMGRMLRERYDKVTDDGMLETLFVHPSKLSYSEAHDLLSSNSGVRDCFVHPDTIDSDFIEHQHGTVAKIHFVPPMSIHDERKLCQIQFIRP